MPRWVPLFKLDAARRATFCDDSKTRWLSSGDEVVVIMHDMNPRRIVAACKDRRFKARTRTFPSLSGAAPFLAPLHCLLLLHSLRRFHCVGSQHRSARSVLALYVVLEEPMHSHFYYTVMNLL